MSRAKANTWVSSVGIVGAAKGVVVECSMDKVCGVATNNNSLECRTQQSVLGG